MGLDASVMCACYQQGLTTPCPFPDAFMIDEFGYPAIRLDGEDDDERSEMFDVWLSECCPHPYMDAITRVIANDRDYRAFRDAVEQIGVERLATLCAALPEDNEGLMTAGDAALCLQELNVFRSRLTDVQRRCLIDTESGLMIASVGRQGEEAFERDERTGLRLGLDDDGFFVRDAWEFNREVFRATRFSQQVLEAETLDQPTQYLFTDLDSERQFTSRTPIRLFVRGEFGLLRQVYPAALAVETRSAASDHFDSVLEPLTAVLAVSVETGNPVRWG